MVDGREKGNKYENAICRVLSVWLFPDLDPKTPIEHLPFRRRSTSVMPIEGHWNGAGDILHRPDLESRWPFCVECKHVEGWSLDGAFSEKWPVWSWWAQAERQAARAGRKPLLVCGRNRKPDYALLRAEDAPWLAQRLQVVRVERPKHPPVAIVLLGDLVKTKVERLSTA
jgi:hypothetical protein